MKTILMNPPAVQFGKRTRTLESGPVTAFSPPLGVGYIAAVLRQAGHRAMAIDAYHWREDKAYEWIVQEQPAALGLSCHSDQRAGAYRLARRVKQAQPALKVFIGGPHATLRPGDVLTASGADAVILGEAERTAAALLDSWEAGLQPQSPGIATLDHMANGLHQLISSPRIDNLDALPYPSHEAFDLDKYATADWIQSVLSLPATQVTLRKDCRPASVISSRGCVNSCAFCNTPLVWRGGIRLRDPAQVAQEIGFLVQNLNRNFIIFNDDIINPAQGRLAALAQAILDAGIPRFAWAAEADVRGFTPDLARLLKESGCTYLVFGIESGAEQVRRRLGKTYSDEEAEATFNALHQVNIGTGAFVLIGGPGETERTISQTLSFLRKVKPGMVIPQIALVLPENVFEREAAAAGLIPEGFWAGEDPAPYWTSGRPLPALLDWHRQLLSSGAPRWKQAARWARDLVAKTVGIRISRRRLFNK